MGSVSHTLNEIVVMNIGKEINQFTYEEFLKFRGALILLQDQSVGESYQMSLDEDGFTLV